MLKSNIKLRNKEVFGNIHNLVKETTERLEIIQRQLIMDSNNVSLRTQETRTRQHLNKSLYQGGDLLV